MQTTAKVHEGIGTLAAGDVLVVLWSEPASPKRWQVVVDHFESLAREYPEGILPLFLILAAAEPPDAELRRRMQADIRRFGPKLRRGVFVPLGDSIWISVVRTIVRTIFLLSGQSKRHMVVATIEDGLERIQEAAGTHTPARPELLAGIETLYRALGVSPPVSGTIRT